LDGIDCIGCAKTGSGKTLAFALPILQKLWEEPYGIFALILTPTRELAYQVNYFFFFLVTLNFVKLILSSIMYLFNFVDCRSICCNW